jgi:hypothetical protein
LVKIDQPSSTCPSQNDEIVAAIPTQLISVNQFILHAVEVAARLDALSTRDDRETILPILQRAGEEYVALVEGRNALVPADSAGLDVMLDNLQARLKFFQKRLCLSPGR